VYDVESAACGRCQRELHGAGHHERRADAAVYRMVECMSYDMAAVEVDEQFVVSAVEACAAGGSQDGDQGVVTAMSFNTTIRQAVLAAALAAASVSITGRPLCCSIATPRPATRRCYCT